MMDLKTRLFIKQHLIYIRIKKRQSIGTDYAFSWKSKGIYNSKFKSLYTAFLHTIKLSGYRMEIKFDKDPLAVE